MTARPRFSFSCATWPKALLFLSFALPFALGGPGHDHGPAMGAAAPSGPVFLSDVQRRNLGLVIQEAEMIEMGATLEVFARLVIPPEKTGQVSAPFPGQVQQVLVKLGQHVQAGDPVLRVSPLSVGSPAQVLTSPVSGHVIRQNSTPGMSFTPENSLIEIGDDSELLAQGVFFQSPECDRIKLGAKASFWLDVFPGEAFPGVLQRLDTGHDAEDASFHIYAVLPNQHHRLRPNYRGRLVIAIEDPLMVVAVPRRAVLGSLGNLFVYVEDEDAHFEKRAVVTGIRSGDYVEIVEGVLPGEKIVTVGNYQLQYIAPEGESAGTAGAHDGHNH